MPKLFVAILVGFFAFASAQAAETTVQARLVRSTGPVTMTLPGGQPTVLALNASIPQGAVITTGANAEAHIQTMSGTIATLKANTTVDIEKLAVTTDAGGTITKQETTVNLRQGNVISTIDPAKKSINNYSVRTAKGVAAARGTAFSVTVNGEALTIASTADSVSFTGPSGAGFTISAGMISITRTGGAAEAPISLAAAAAANPEVAAALAATVNTLATIIQNNLGEIPAASITNIASQVVAAAATAAPSTTAAVTAQVVAAMNAPGSSTSGTTTVNSISQVIAAAVTSAPAEALNVATSVSAAAPSQTGIIAATIMEAAPNVASQVIQTVATASGQSQATVTNNANAIPAEQVQQNVNQAVDVTTPVITPPETTVNLPIIDIGIISGSAPPATGTSNP